MNGNLEHWNKRLNKLYPKKIRTKKDGAEYIKLHHFVNEVIEKTGKECIKVHHIKNEFDIK